MSGPTLKNPTFIQLQGILPELSYAECYYAVNSVTAISNMDDDTVIPWSGAYGAAIYNALSGTLGMFVGGDRVRYIYGQTVTRITAQLEDLFSEDVRASLPWRVLLADGTYVIVDGIEGILNIKDFSRSQQLSPPLYMLSVDLTTVWWNLREALERIRNVPHSTAEPGVQPDVSPATADGA